MKRKKDEKGKDEKGKDEKLQDKKQSEIRQNKKEDRSGRSIFLYYLNFKIIEFNGFDKVI